jgi:hypothetical protein
MRSTTTTTSPTTTPPTPAPRAVRGVPVRSFLLHYAEMLVAMLVGMVALGWVEGLLVPGLMDRADVGALVMATNMAVGMGAWMRVRGSGWRAIADMSGAMYLPFLALLVPYWAGGIPGGAVLLWGHVLMLPAMALAMLARPAEHAG